MYVRFVDRGVARDVIRPLRRSLAMRRLGTDRHNALPRVH